MKRVAHDIDPDTGLIRGVMVNEEDLENKPKKQMVITVVFLILLLLHHLR